MMGELVRTTRLLVAAQMLFGAFSFSWQPFDLILKDSSARASVAGSRWTRVNVEGAVCGNGEPYAYFMREGRADKLTIELKGGGACWDALTCFGPVPLTQLWLQEPRSGDGIDSETLDESVLFDSTYVTFPYCTGDIHAGDHIASYSGRNVYHNGAENVRLALADLQNKEVFSHLSEVNVVGGSAGALGVLLHLHQINAIIDSETEQAARVKRSAIVDSPGLHFGDSFFDKFPEEYFYDLQTMMSAAGVELEKNTGNISPSMKNICILNSNWKIGILQSTRDRIMSLIFGNIAQFAHQQLVLGKTGISELGRRRYGRCAVWIHDSARHTFVFDRYSASDRTRDVSAAEFAFSVLGNLETGSTLP